MTTTYISLREAKGEELLPREKELAERLQGNTEVRITLPHLRDKYPAGLIELAQESLALKTQASKGNNNRERLKYLETKLRLEIEYLRFLMDDIKDSK